MKTNLFRLQKRCPLLFEIFYGQTVNNRRRVRSINKKVRILQEKLQEKADEFWGWEDDRDAYNACIIAACYLQEIKENLQNEPD